MLCVCKMTCCPERAHLKSAISQRRELFKNRKIVQPPEPVTFRNLTTERLRIAIVVRARCNISDLRQAVSGTFMLLLPIISSPPGS